MNDKNKEPMIFADGMNIYLPNEKTVKFLYGNLSFNVKKFKEFLDKHENEKGYVKVKLPISSRTNTPYAVLDTYVSKPKDEVKPMSDEYDADSIGF